jgi:hypothetical protein
MSCVGSRRASPQDARGAIAVAARSIAAEVLARASMENRARNRAPVLNSSDACIMYVLLIVRYLDSGIVALAGLASAARHHLPLFAAHRMRPRFVESRVHRVEHV